jgi:tRNA nucleotidyltransferase (CCA-adding enzyme)
LRLYLAGGVVRDLLSGQPVRDVDLVVEADAAAVAAFVRDLARELSAAAHPHDRFGTAVLTLPGGERLDVAAARRETYASPGALPTVALPASIEEDLARRDFTVNAMALALSPGRGLRLRLVDPFGGARDLVRRTLRALHPASFVDDPTRALRGVRYANRYGLRLDTATRRAIARAVAEGAFDRVSGDRLRRELVKIFGEPGRAAAVRILRRLGLDRAIVPALGRVRGEGPRLRRVESLVSVSEEPEAGWLAYLLAWAGGLRPAELRSVADRLGLAGSERARLLGWPATRRRLGGGLARRRVSEIARRIGGLSAEEHLAAAAALSPVDRRALANARRRVAQRPLIVRGADLIAAGVPPGEAIGRALGRTQDALLDRRISDRDALAYALRIARRGGRP